MADSRAEPFRIDFQLPADRGARMHSLFVELYAYFELPGRDRDLSVQIIIRFDREALT